MDLLTIVELANTLLEYAQSHLWQHVWEHLLVEAFFYLIKVLRSEGEVGDACDSDPSSLQADTAYKTPR